MQNQRFRDTRTNEIVTEVPISEITHFEEFNGTALYACKVCGCTDVECSAWITVNTEELSSSDGPVDNCWCPQCEHDGRESDIGKHRYLKMVAVAKPVKAVAP